MRCYARNDLERNAPAAIARSRPGEKAASKMAAAPAMPVGGERAGPPNENADRRVCSSLGDNVSVLTGIPARNERPRTTRMAPEAGGRVRVRVARV